MSLTTAFMPTFGESIQVIGFLRSSSEDLDGTRTDRGM
jgi:hypothetical protein